MDFQGLSLPSAELVKIPPLKEELIVTSERQSYKAGTLILQQGKYVRVIPLLESGLVILIQGALVIVE